MRKSFIQFTIILLVMLLCFTFGCQQQVEEGITEEVAAPPVDIEAEKANVKSVLEQYVEAWKAEDIEMFVKIFATNEDMVMFTSESATLFVGWASWKEMFESYFEPIEFIDISFKDEVIKVHDSGKVAWITGMEDSTFIYQGQENSAKGMRVTWILEKRNGNWVIVHAHWSLPAEL